MTQHFIAIGGCSCSGKTTLADYLARDLGAEILPLDAYYAGLSHLTLQQRGRVNFDAPEAIDVDLLLADVRRLASGKDIDRPVYDFTTHSRTAGLVRVPSTRFIILDGLFALHWPEIRDLCGLKVYVDLDESQCLNRRLERDVRERGRTPESVRRQFEDTVLPMARRYVIPTKQYADIVVSGAAPVGEAAQLVLLRVRSAGTDRAACDTPVASADGSCI
jgi:uridine kinase